MQRNFASEGSETAYAEELSYKTVSFCEVHNTNALTIIEKVDKIVNQLKNTKWREI